MNHAKEEFFKGLLIYGTQNDVDVNDKVLENYAANVDYLGLNWNHLLAGLKKHMENYNGNPSRSIPSPRMLLKYLEKELPNTRELARSDATEAAARILTAISKFGYIDPDGARKYIGDLGWEVVGMQGGWISLCENVTVANETIYQAQMRELAQSIVNRRSAGVCHPPKLPSANTNAKITSILDKMNDHLLSSDVHKTDTPPATIKSLLSDE